MKEKIEYIIKTFGNYIQIALKLLLVCVLIFGSYEYLNKVFYNKELDGGKNFRALPENSLDVVVLGSSHAQYSFVPSFFYYDSGLYSYVMGSSCQPYEISYQMLKETLKTQTPKLVIMEVFTAMPMSSMCESDSCYIRAANMMTGDERIQSISYLSEEKAEEYKNEFFNYHNDWKTMEDYDSLKPSEVFKEETISSEFGYVFQEREEDAWNWWFGKSYSEDLEVTLQDIDLESLNNIYELCQENAITLLLYKTPVDSITQEDQSYLHQVWKWADEHEVDYLDFTKLNKEMNLYIQIHTDSYHAYVNGASLITQYIGNYVKDMKIDFSHEELEDLTAVYKKGTHFYGLAAVRSETDPAKYIKRMINSDDYIIINYNPEKGVMSEKMYNLLLGFGLDQESFSRYDSYYAIIKDGKVINESKNCAGYDEKGIYSSYGSTSYEWVETIEKKPTALTITMVMEETGDIVQKDIDTRTDFDYGETDYNRY